MHSLSFPLLTSVTSGTTLWRMNAGLKDTNNLAEAPQILKRMYQPLRGPDLCHTDVVNCMVLTDTGKLITGG
jgi:hypothetical protein